MYVHRFRHTILRMEKRTMKKFLVTLVLLILAAVVGYLAIGRELIDKYTYGKEYADLQEYFGVSGEQAAILLQNDLLQERAILRDGRCYFPMSVVEEYLTDGFYYEEEVDSLLFTTADTTYAVEIGSDQLRNTNGSEGLGYPASFRENNEIYLETDLLSRFARFSVSVYDYHVQLKTQWGLADMRKITDDTQVRVLGGIKSPILKDVAEGDSVELLEEMETWSKVKTSDALIGYVENKKMRAASSLEEIPAQAPDLPEYTSVSLDGKAVVGFHAIYSEGGNDTLGEALSEAPGMNVIAPTWYSIQNEAADYRSYASASYVEKAHEKGLQVWPVWDNFNYALENGTSIDTVSLFSSMEMRDRLARTMVDETIAIGADGINLDMEGLPSECGPHYVQFLKELGILCRRQGLVFSIDNYVPFHFNNFYRLDVQGRVADYVIIMGYDEHTLGSSEQGSVASIDYVSNGLDRTLDQVPAGKVINALPLYTILWSQTGSEPGSEYITLNNVDSFVERTGIEPEWNEETCQNYAEWTSGETTYRIWLEDEESILAKLNVMKAKEIGGAAAWRLGYGTPEVWQLISGYAGD